MATSFVVCRDQCTGLDWTKAGSSAIESTGPFVAMAVEKIGTKRINVASKYTNN